MDTYKTVVGSLPWTDRTEWLYPAADRNRIDWWFIQGPIDVDPALEIILPHLEDRDCCVQAGGVLGFGRYDWLSSLMWFIHLNRSRSIINVL